MIPEAKKRRFAMHDYADRSQQQRAKGPDIMGDPDSRPRQLLPYYLERCVCVPSPTHPLTCSARSSGVPKAGPRLQATQHRIRRNRSGHRAPGTPGSRPRVVLVCAKPGPLLVEICLKCVGRRAAAATEGPKIRRVVAGGVSPPTLQGCKREV